MSDTTGAVAPEALTVHGIAGVAATPGFIASGDEVLFPDRSSYVALAEALRAGSFVTCSDLCGVDYLAHPTRAVAPGVTAERFEVVVHLLSHERRQHVRLRVQVPETDPHCPTLFQVFPGTENMEREAYDMFGIVFDDHPDMTRILMPEDWEGHPLRKDYSVGRVPVQFKGAPGPR
jgi:NADH-quinone oxidoreductase subunit C